MLLYSSLSHKRELILSGKLDLLQNVKFFLENIEKNKNLNSFLFVNSRILEEAQQLLEKVNSGLKPGSLFGAVIAVKDVISVEGMPMTCGSKSC